MTEKRWTKAPYLAKWAGEGEGQGRAYTDPTTGKDYPSVTTVLKNTPKADMMGWAALKVAEVIIDQYDRIGGDPAEVMKWLPYAHNRFRDERAWVGSGVHAQIQSDFEGTWDYYDLDAEQLRMLQQWEKFCLDYNVRILYSEVTVLLEGVMGTFDAIIEYTDPLSGEDKIGLIDLKTSKSIWAEHHMQLSALAHGTHFFRRVEPGTEGACEFKKKIDGKTVTTHWVKLPMFDFQTVAAVHLREDFYDFIEIDEEELDLQYDKFVLYAGIHELNQKLKEKGFIV